MAKSLRKKALASAPSRFFDTIYEHIRKYYPDDAAIGFKPGDIRGAFVVKIDTNNISQE